MKYCMAHGCPDPHCKFVHDLVPEEEALFAALNEDMTTHMYEIAAIDEAAANKPVVKLPPPKGLEKQALGACARTALARWLFHEVLHCARVLR